MLRQLSSILSVALLLALLIVHLGVPAATCVQQWDNLTAAAAHQPRTDRPAHVHTSTGDMKRAHLSDFLSGNKLPDCSLEQPQSDQATLLTAIDPSLGPAGLLTAAVVPARAELTPISQALPLSRTLSPSERPPI